ncbi:FK506-binding protein 13 [Tasmannia lanceolata]|uniref:FK506-binding protein 13 n=1 Tax=Tasmannia lanceolata TaxID=3420 RepID=UPI00406288AA
MSSSSATLLHSYPKPYFKNRSIRTRNYTKTVVATETHFPIPTHDPNKLKISQLKLSQKKLEEGFTLTRRDTIGCLGFYLGAILHADFVNPNPSLASEDAQCATLTVAPSGLEFCDRVVGTGIEATKGQLIKAHYTGKLENGKVFDSSYGRGKPLTFRVGVGEVIKGWDQGILGGDGIPPMLPGGKRTLKLPPELGYGMRGAGCKGGSCIIPPDSVLLFDVEFIG